MDPGGGFYQHLYRGSDLLEAGRVDEACQALEEALALQPDNAEALSLWAEALFKLGRYDEAIGAYRQLIEARPGQPTLHVNLALVLIKANRLDEAEGALREGLACGGDSKRLHGYLGLVYSKKREFEKALIAFNKAGSAKMVAEMEELIRKRQQGLSQEPAPAHKHESASAAEQALEKDMAAVVERTRPAAADTAERRRRLLGLAPPPPGTEPGGAPLAATPGEPGTRPSRIPGRAYRIPLSGVPGRPLVVEAPGLLRLGLAEGVVCALGDAALVRGTFTGEPLNKRFKGKSTKAVFGIKEDPFCRLEGEGELWLHPGAGREVFAFDLASKGKAFVVEAALYAFTANLSWENGRIGSSDEASIDLVTLSGEGSFALATGGGVSEVHIEDEELLVSRKALLGWTGRLVPRLLSSPEGVPAEVGALVRLKGTGRVLLGRTV